MRLIKTKAEKAMEAKLAVRQGVNELKKCDRSLEKKKNEMIRHAQEAKQQGISQQYAVAVNGLKMIMAYNGESDEMARWLVIPVKVINWSHDYITLGADTMETQVVYNGSYGFTGAVDYDSNQLAPLEFTTGILSVRVPTLVSKAAAGELGLWVNSEGIEFREELDLAEAEKARQQALAQYSVDSVITFGHYEQDGDVGNGAEPIEWIVLECDGNTAMLISRYALDCKPYNDSSTGVTWETCTLRQWLNSDFINVAFDYGEQVKLKKTLVKAEANPDSYYGIDQGSDTQDQVFLLSVNEAKNYLADSARSTQATKHAVNQGASLYGACWWWLRSLEKGIVYTGAAMVHPRGLITMDTFDNDGICVRPVIVLWLY